MKKVVYTFLLLFSLATVFTSCREESTGEKVEDAVESAADGVEDAVD